MLRTILIFGAAAGLIVAVPMFLMLGASADDFNAEHGMTQMLIGYSLMLIAFSLTFVAIKRYRDRTLGGVIKFLPALLIGLGITFVAGVFYVVGWEITLAATDYAFLETYPQSMIAQAQASGATAEEIAAMQAEMAAFTEWYSVPWMRMLGTFFLELFPVGLIVSLISALLLRNSRFLPARRSPQAA